MHVQRSVQLQTRVSQNGPQQQAGEHQADGQDLLPGAGLGVPQRASDFPSSVTGFTGGELDGLIVHLISAIFGLRLLRAQSEGLHTAHFAEKENNV